MTNNLTTYSILFCLVLAFAFGAKYINDSGGFTTSSSEVMVPEDADSNKLSSETERKRPKKFARPRKTTLRDSGDRQNNHRDQSEPEWSLY